MDVFLKLVLPFLATPKTYSEVLTKLASFAFYETYLITLLLRAIPKFNQFLVSIESWGPLGSLIGSIPRYDVLNISGIAIAAIVAVLTHTFQLHDRISDLLRIRQRFDCKEILLPLARKVGSTASTKKIAGKRDELMHSVFYKYASSGADTPLVDRHDIEQALNAWSWYWAFVEGVFYFGVGALTAWLLGSPDLFFTLIAVSAALLLLSLLQRIRLARYARPQIDTIAADPTAAYSVKKQFDAL
jgi:hypothetical protein